MLIVLHQALHRKGRPKLDPGGDSSINQYLIEDNVSHAIRFGNPIHGRRRTGQRKWTNIYLYSEHGGDKEKALALAQTAKEALPKDPRVSDTLGWILYKRGIYRSALQLLRESAAKLSDNPEIHYHLGMTHYRLGNTEEAKKALAKALQLNAQFPGVEKARHTLAEIE